MKCEECDREVADNQWARIRAHADGWFERKDGRAWCPDDVPQWVAQWRNSTRNEKENNQ